MRSNELRLNNTHLDDLSLNDLPQNNPLQSSSRHHDFSAAANSKGLGAIGLFLLMSTLSGCGLFGGDERPVYQGAEYYKNLEVPPDLTVPDVTEELKIPIPDDRALQRFRENNKLETVITPKFDGVRVVSAAGDSWLEIDNPVEVVWPRLVEFWQQEGIELAVVSPLLGFMETEWVAPMGTDAGFFRSMFQKFEPDYKDKFRLRVERFDDDTKTRVFIANTRIERTIVAGESNDIIWITLPSDVEAERQILSRMALFAGMSEDNSVQLLENYRPYSSLVKVDSTNTTALTMNGSMDFVWSRAMRALDRMSMENIEQQRAENTISFEYGKVADEVLRVKQGEEADELAESSWLRNLFSNKDDKGPTADMRRSYRLVFTDLDGVVRIEVKDAMDSRAIDEEGAVSSTVRVERIRNLLIENLE